MLSNVVVEIRVGQGGWTVDTQKTARKQRLTFKSGDPNFSRPRMVKLGGDRIMLFGFTNLGGRGEKESMSSKTDNNVTVMGPSR